MSNGKPPDNPVWFALVTFALGIMIGTQILPSKVINKCPETDSRKEHKH